MKNERKIERIDRPQIKSITSKRVAAYCRVSMDCDKLRNSFANQVSYYSDLIQKTPNWEYAGVYNDYAESGTGTIKRHGFNEMLEDAKAGKIDIILTKSISRFARNTVDLLNAIRELKNIGVEVRFEKENIRTLTSEGELMISLLASFAQNESEAISDNVKWAHRKRFQMGIPMKNKMFGFDYENKEFTINKKEADIIKLVFKKFLEGLSYTEIASIVNGLGMKTRKGYNFNQLSIKDILRQEKYAGFTLAQKRFIESPLTHKSKRNKGELPQYIIENSHPAIIDRKIFDKAQERIKYIHDNKSKCHKQSSWFTGLVKCPICGKSMIKINKTSIRCIGNSKNHTCDNMQTLKISELEDFVKGVDLKKVDHIVFNKIRTNRFSRKGYHPTKVVPRNIKKGDFKIIWKKTSAN